MNSLTLLKSTLAVWLLCGIGMLNVATTQHKSNVILLMTDEQGYGEVGW